MTSPKLFVSYSWSSPDHEAWVLQLATDLRESGVDVILDKWDLKEGHDANAFMEKMVTDKEIKKVILVCDKAYVEKTDNRKGGVGTEAQIISAEVYAAQEQGKFVAVIKERNEDGSACVPVYYKSRIYIDLSDPSTYSENFEVLLRWIFDQPLHNKPALGEKPAYLSEEEGGVSIPTSTRFRRAIDAVKNGREYAIPAVSEYLELLAVELETFRIDGSSEPFDDEVVKSIDAFLPYRNEAIELFLTVATYLDTEEARIAIHRFFEQLIPYLDRPREVTSYSEWDFDNFCFIVHELFLYAVACFIKHERFESASYLMGNEYYIAGRSEYGRDVMISYSSIRRHMRSLEHRNKRLELRRLSLRGDLLEQRCKGLGVPFQHVMQADFILFMRDHIDRPEESGHWFPETLLFAGRHSGPFEVFARSKSAAYFDRAKILLGIDSKEQLQPVLDKFKENPRYYLPRWEFESFSPPDLLGFNDIATKP